MVKPSRKLLIALKLDERRQYRIAQLASLNPSTLSRLLNGIDPLRPLDERIIAVGQVISVPPNECFEEAVLTE